MTDNRKVKITAVDPPQNLTATENGYDRIDLAWSPVAGADGYSVYRSDSLDGAYTKITDVPSASYSDTGLNEATSYYYRVTATSAGEESPQSDYATATTRAIGIPTVTAAARSASEIELTWNAIADATNYLVYRSNQEATGYVLIDRTTTPDYLDSGLSPLTTYYYRVRTGVGALTSDFSATASATTLQATPETPANFKATAINDAEIELSWDAARYASGYRIYRSDTPDGARTQIADTASLSYLDRGLNPDTTYYYFIEAYDGNLVSPETSTSTATNPLAPPENLTAKGVSESEIYLSWQPSQSGEVGYKVYVSATENGDYRLLATTADTHYAMSGLNPAETRYFRVRAVRSSFASAYTPAAGAATLSAAPPTITSRFFCVTLRWCPIDADVYVVTRRSDRESCFCPVARTRNNAVYDCGLIKGAAYEYKVFAACRDGWRKIAEYRIE